MVYTLVCHAQVKKEHVDDMAAKLREARKVYEQDSETLHWFVMQDVHDATKFTIVERFVKESSQEEHLSNPYWATFNPTVEPWLVKPIEILRHEEL
ncbi:hypothetical protein DMC30DRAFT_448982 [Rhodotorula diobovata]|uniref:ABM domain-containing protein n=1 Tax=Rhodotorula diobovata TaxID=5288 RepID=A0A5C5FQR4_9BASI|nr:hypothetical protein DMC30DRAFT_448982 [Rhodotorula diobovata]